MPEKQQIIERARHILTSAEAVADALESVNMRPETNLESMPASESTGAFAAAPRQPSGMSATDRGESTPVTRAVAEERAQRVADGIEAMKKIDSGREDHISPQEQVGLEAIILLTGRPAILIQDGDFMEPPKPWTDLKNARSGIRSVIQRVGRIDVSQNPNFDWLGTGFLAGADVVVTNRHVAMEFSRSSAPDTWTFRTPMGASLDLKAEFGSSDSLQFKITEIIGIHDTYDMALLRVERASSAGTLPAPLPIASSSPSGASLVGRKVYLIGYPAWDGRRNDPEPMRRIFSDIYNVKRLQPGEIAGEALAAFEILHDCSTLGGNSGSPVIDLETHRVMGLHFGGRYLEKNHAIPLWTLQADPLVKRATLNFQ